jgi:hypothetical protein
MSNIDFFTVHTEILIIYIKLLDEYLHISTTECQESDFTIWHTRESIR